MFCEIVDESGEIWPFKSATKDLHILSDEERSPRSLIIDMISVH